MMLGSRAGKLLSAGLVWLLYVDAASITNCGGAQDLLQLTTLNVSPDPIPHRGSFTITAEGTLSKPFVSGKAATNFDIKVFILGQQLADRHFENETEFELDPEVPAGPVKLVIGPTTLPPLPGQVDLTGKVTIVDATGAPVACVAIDLHAPLALAGPAAAEAEVPAPRDPPMECPKAGDKLHDVTWSKNGTWNQYNAVLDETVTQTLVKTSFQVFLGKFPMAVKLDVPIVYEPGVPAGPLHIRVKRPEAEAAASSTQANPAPGQGVHIVGDIVALDSAGAEITCRHIDNQPPPPSHTGREDIVVV